MNFELHDQENSEDAKKILENLRDYNLQFTNEKSRELTITLKSETGEIIAGLNGHTSWEWLFVKLLWVSESARGRGARGGRGGWPRKGQEALGKEEISAEKSCQEGCQEEIISNDSRRGRRRYLGATS